MLLNGVGEGERCAPAVALSPIREYYWHYFPSAVVPPTLSARLPSLPPPSPRGAAPRKETRGRWMLAREGGGVLLAAALWRRLWLPWTSGGRVGICQFFFFFWSCSGRPRVCAYREV
jgi:hypothetical protein